LRFFTVYGPWGRPDMALFKFTKAILNGDFIDVYNEGKMWRDFTYIDDIIEGIVRVTDHIPGSHISRFYRLYNIGNHSPVELMYFIRVLEDVLGEKAKMNLLPMQPGDVQVTSADVDDLMSDVNFAPSTSIEKGIGAFVEWYKWFNEEQEHR
jgi:UDP-glucuronate 4-epimerase